MVKQKTIKLNNKWQIFFQLSRDVVRRETGWKQIVFGIFKLHTMPMEGERINKGLYKGFILNYRFFFPIEKN